MTKLQRFLVVLTTVVLAMACHPPPAMEPRGSIEQVDQRVAIAFAAARTALEVLDAAEVLYLDEGTRTGKFKKDDPRFDESAKRIARLIAIRTALERVRQHISGDVKADLKQVLDDLELGLAAAKAAGVNVPPVVSTSIKTLQELS